MRKENSNQFTEGLVCDLNPVNTPNTVLTDALNATLITYDGNEFSLQNDRGNYPLENCKLKPNYIPVGLKEYGDILYIVSYNPLDDSVEIGTYPSPMEVIGSKNNETSLDLQSVLEFAEDGSKYSELIEECETKIWISDNEENSKLYPGDKYKIEEIEKSPYKYEALEYYIIDEDRKKYNITDLMFQKEPDENGFRNVSWQIPGWLAAQYRLATFDDFSMNIRSLEAPSLSTNNKIECTVKLNFQFKISDKLFLPSKFNKNVESDIGIKIEINDKEVEDLSLSKGRFIDWYSDSKILWIDTIPITVKDVELGSSLYIKATPYIKITTETISKKIIYDSFVEENTVALTSVGSYDDFKIGTDLWKFYIDDSNDELYLEYDITGPYVTASEVDLYYRVLDMDENLLTGWNTVLNYAGITNQGIGIIPFEREFKKEGIYIIEFAFYKKNASNDDLKKAPITRKLVIASKIFSDFVGEYANFNDISFDTWIHKYKDHIKTKNWKTEYIKGDIYPYSNFTFNRELIVNGQVFKSNALRNLWNLDYMGDGKGLFTSDDWETTIKSKTEKLISGSKSTVRLSIASDSEILDGPLWDGTPDITVKLDSYITPVSQISVSKEKITDIETSIDAVFGSQMDITYESIDSFEYASNLINVPVDDIPIMHVYFEGDDDSWNDFLKIKYWNLGTLSNIRYGTEYTDSVSEEYRLESNTVSRTINNLLGTKQVGVLFTSICLDERIAGKLEYRHGKSVQWSDGNGSNTWLFTYLLFRKTDSDNNVAMIQLDNSELWNKCIGPANLYEITSSSISEDIFKQLKYVINSIFNNIVICTKNNSITKGHVIQIKYREPEILPICSIDVLTNKFTGWIYKTQSGNYNLLSETTRAYWKNRFKDFCGKLFDGNTTTIEAVYFYRTDVKNTTDPSISFKSTIDKIAILNSRINSYNQSDIVKELKKRGTKTKGVYWTGENTIAGGLIELLDSKYSVSNSQYLTIGKSNLEDANVYLTDDNDGIVFGRVDTKVYVKM